MEWNKTKLPLCKRRARIVQNFCPFLVPHNVFWSLCPKLCRVVYRSGKCVAINLSTFGRVITCMDGTSNTSRRTQKTQIVLWNSCQMSEASIKRMHVIVCQKFNAPVSLGNPLFFFSGKFKIFKGRQFQQIISVTTCQIVLTQQTFIWLVRYHQLFRSLRQPDRTLSSLYV